MAQTTFDTDFPTRLNGFAVIAACPVKPIGEKKSYSLALDRGAAFTERYVAAMHNLGEDEWYYGYYTSDMEKALAVYTERVIRYGVTI